MKASLEHSYLWEDINTLSLRVNMRVELARRAGEAADMLADYAQFLLSVGHGTDCTFPARGSDVVALPINIVPLTSTILDVIEDIWRFADTV